MRASALILAAALSLPLPSAAQGPPATDAAGHVRLATAAYREKRYDDYLTHMREAARLRPGNPTIAYNLAGALALNGDGATALAGLRRVAEMGLDYDAAADTDFDAVRETPAFAAVLARFAKNRRPAGAASPAFSLADRELLTEGVAYDAARGRFLVSSVRRRKIVAVDAAGRASDFSRPGDGLWGALGSRADARRGLLWVASSALPQMEGFAKEDAGKSALFKYELASGKLLGRYDVSGPGPHALGDCVVAPNGDVYTTDSATPAVYVLRAGAAALEPLAGPGPFVSPQGLDLAPDGRTLFVADYARGLFRVDTRTGAATAIAQPEAVATLGVDGLYLLGGDLVGVQNGVRPQRVVRFRLDRDMRAVTAAEVLAANLPEFDEPTLGAVVGRDFYFVARSQWPHFRNDGTVDAASLREPLVMKLRL
jgi:sugar lactone lactonase YvrE